MFTGIVEEVGQILKITSNGISAAIEIKADKVMKGTNLGDSIAINGVCITVTKIHNGSFQGDIMAETLRRSNLGELKSGDSVNLEQAATLSTRLGGHLVSGHIDGRGIIKSKIREEIAVRIQIQTEPVITDFMVEKGSVAIDGISLTITKVGHGEFEVSVIPHTMEHTTLLKKGINGSVNLECDLIGKYVNKFMKQDRMQQKDSRSGITTEFLIQNGF
ncbi:MAG: riboflavin synthase [Lachnospiraceae bacterium]